MTDGKPRVYQFCNNCQRYLSAYPGGWYCACGYNPRGPAIVERTWEPDPKELAILKAKKGAE